MSVFRFTPKFKLKQLEMTLLVVMLGLLVGAIVGPAITQPAHQHAFADQRIWAGIPFAMDVLSNLSFGVWGVAGLKCLFSLAQRTGRASNAKHALAGLFFTGLVCTAAPHRGITCSPTMQVWELIAWVW